MSTSPDEPSAELGNSPDPTWLMHVRPRGGSGPYRELRVAARSALQAEAIIRRQGLEAEMAGCRIVDGPPASPRQIATAPVGRLICSKCGYQLDGLIVVASIVDCPECGHAQVILAYNPSPEATVADQSRARPRPGVLHTFGARLALLIALLGVVMTVWSMIFW